MLSIYIIQIEIKTLLCLVCLIPEILKKIDSLFFHSIYIESTKTKQNNSENFFTTLLRYSFIINQLLFILSNYTLHTRRSSSSKDKEGSKRTSRIKPLNIQVDVYINCYLSFSTIVGTRPANRRKDMTPEEISRK